ncbi:hypothetical protein [Pseudomonas putida]|uniref:Uncharacterized protein n=1 Tax=Pseudomonas putida TaxID=303 RepID=A0A1Q9R9Z3_PSEPU|nr:hypothetical protein [Pseudomonas putida]OLS64151.1 hypothetical protein PSEMO_09640 [Pseudomonas putida]
MKKCVPDPPLSLCINPGLTHDEAVTKAIEHLKKSIEAAAGVPEPPEERHRTMLTNARLDMRIAKALLVVAVSRSTVSVPV